MVYHNSKSTFLHYIITVSLSIFLICGSSALAKMQEPTTTRLKSTAGAGVASILLDEATMLNPAPMAFFNKSALYVSRVSSKIELDSDSNFDSPKDSSYMNFIVSDAARPTKGSFNYTFQNHDRSERKRYSFAMANALGKSSAMGVTYRYTEERLHENGIARGKSKNHQMVMGITHIINKYVNLGMVFNDPFQQVQDESLGVVGAQLTYNNIITLMTDIGANYYEDMSETFQYRGALQVRAFSDFYIRFGMFRDRAREEKGNGAGVSWVSPRLIIDLAIKNTEVDKSLELDQRAESIKETALSLSAHF